MGDRFFPWRREPLVDSSSWDSITEERINSSRYARALAEALGLTNASLLSCNRRGAPPRLLPRPPDFPNHRPHLLYEARVAAPGAVGVPYLNLLDWAHDDALSLPLFDELFLVRNCSIVERLLQLHMNPITCASWAPHSTHMALANASSSLRLLDAHAGRVLRTLPKVPAADFFCAVSWWDPHCFSAGRRHGSISGLDMRLPDPYLHRCSHHTDPICGLRVAADGLQLASGDRKGSVCTWDLRSARRCHRLEGHRGAVKALTWCPFDADVLVTGGADGDNTIRFWDANSGLLKHTLETCSEVWGLAWNIQDRALVSAHGHPCGMLASWRYRTKFQLEKIPFEDELGASSPITSLAATPDGRKLALGMEEEEAVQFWKVLHPSSATPKPKPRSSKGSIFLKLRWKNMTGRQCNILSIKTGIRRFSTGQIKDGS